MTNGEEKREMNRKKETAKRDQRKIRKIKKIRKMRARKNIIWASLGRQSKK